jgi:hypothetical protein
MFVVAFLVGAALPVAAQAPGQWPPDSLINVHVFPRETPVSQVVGAMRSFSLGLGVRCTFCHVAEEGASLAQTDFASDDKRNKLVARQMMRMVQEINRRLDTIPQPGTPRVQVTCETCHRGVSRPVPLETIIAADAINAGADSAIRAYLSLRERYYGHDAYDFSEGTLNTAALRVARAGKPDEALALLGTNEQHFPKGASTHVTRGNIELLRGDTTAAEAAYRKALELDPENAEARGRLRSIGRLQR